MMFGHSIGGLNLSKTTVNAEKVTKINTDNPRCNIYKDAVNKLNVTGYISNSQMNESWNNAFGSICGDI